MNETYYYYYLFYSQGFLNIYIYIKWKLGW